MQLQQTVSPAMVQLTGEATGVVVPAGQRLTIETSPGGAEILDAVVPAGKQWNVSISVDVRQTDS